MNKNLWRQKGQTLNNSIEVTLISKANKTAKLEKVSKSFSTMLDAMNEVTNHCQQAFRRAELVNNGKKQTFSYAAKGSKLY